MGGVAGSRWSRKKKDEILIISLFLSPLEQLIDHHRVVVEGRQVSEQTFFLVAPKRTTGEVGSSALKFPRKSSLSGAGNDLTGGVDPAMGWPKWATENGRLRRDVVDFFLGIFLLICCLSWELCAIGSG